MGGDCKSNFPKLELKSGWGLQVEFFNLELSGLQVEFNLELSGLQVEFNLELKSGWGLQVEFSQVGIEEWVGVTSRVRLKSRWVTCTSEE